MITPKLSDIVGITNKIAPAQFAESWDNVGLQLGEPAQEVSRIMVALDPGAPAIEAAIADRCDLLVTHHPFFFTPLKKITSADETGRLALRAVKNDLAIISLHTNYDIASGGVNDLLAGRLGLSDCQPLKITGAAEYLKLVVFVPKGHEEALLKALSPSMVNLGNYRDCSFQADGVGRFTPLQGANPFVGSVGRPQRQEEGRLEVLIAKQKLAAAVSALKGAHPYEEPAFDIYPVLNQGEVRGLGRIGVLAEPMSAAAFALQVKQALAASGVRLVGNPERAVKKIALCGGSGASLLHEAARKGADVLVTGDVKYHEAREAEALGLALVDAGHFATEWPMVHGLAAALVKALEARKYQTEVVAYQGEREPFSFF
ncbi:Nif3-like dinuclear metal center hexameric protein [Geomonas silvestris]|nr:Nif3-like dinuclear metal center hexameric protein [Geomonas silvestris]